MSDDEEHSSTEDDFSASEDEWKPGKTNRPATDDESDDDDSDFEGNASSSKLRESKSQKGSSKSDSVTKQTKKRKSTGTSLRTKLFNKYKPPPKTLRNQKTPAKPTKETPISATHSTKKLHRTVNKPDSSESDSSGDDYLVNPDEIDLQSSFFDTKPSTSGEANAGPPQFDCNAGMKLSDSDEDDGVDDDDDEESYSTKRSVNANSANPVDLGYLLDFAKNLDKAKVLYKEHKDRSVLAEESKVDVSSLLAIGESKGNSTSTVQPKKTKNPKRQSKKTQPNKAASDTDSDWEEVEAGHGVACAPQSAETLADGIQVCVELPQRQRKENKAIDLEAVLKRQLNRVIKENQIFLHKVSLLGHIYNGFYLNKIASNIHLMPIALKLLPSKNVYPSDQTEIKYFQSMVTWFKTAIKIHDNRMFPQIKIDPVRSLALQMKNHHAVCRRDFILMFVILLRAMGMQCRLVVNLSPIPLKPPQSSLCSLKMKLTDSDNKKDAEKKTNEKKSVKKEPIKSPPLSRKAKEDLLRKVDSLEKEIAQKKREKLKPKSSFEDDLETKAPPLVKAAKHEKKSLIEGKPSCSQKSSARKTDVKREDMKRKSLDNTQEPEKKKKIAGPALKKSPYFPDSSKQSEVVSLEVHSKSLDNPPSIPINTKRKKTATTAPKKSPYFPDSSKSVERSLELPSNSFDDQPSISIKSSVSPIIVKKPNITRSKSPKTYISSEFLQTKARKAQHSDDVVTKVKRERSPNPSPSAPVKAFISSDFLKARPNRNATARVAIESKIEKPSPRRLRSKTKLTVPQLDGADDVPKMRRRKQPLKKTKPNSEDDFEPSPPKRSKAVEKLDRRVLSPETAEECSSAKKNHINMWVEVYSELEAQWVCVDLFKGKVHCVESIRKTVTPSTLAYVFAYNNDSTLKDVTPRYCPQWATVVRKGRVEQAWLDQAVRQYVSTCRSQIDLTEDMDLRRIHLDKPLPSTIMEYKDHPLYALERHLLKFQAIYPPNALTLGFVRGEAVYARECVHTLHSREIWLKSARVVKPGEQPYKIVKARPKWDKFTSTVIKDQPLEIFGYWQTQDYEPPTAENGIVPRNAYGNVELFKECMLPKKTVHLHLPGLNRTCKKLGIDCAPAVIGFDFHQGSCHPLYDGFVVCEEFAEKVADAWEKDQQEAERKEQEKYEARVYGNWKRLIKGLLIKERLKLKYNF